MRVALRFVPGLVLMMAGLPAAAAALHCVAVNGNVTCAGAGAASCQTVNGHTICTSGDGSVVQSFGGAPDAAAAVMPDDGDQDSIDDDDAPSPPQWRGPQRAGHDAAKLPAARTPRG